MDKKEILEKRSKDYKGNIYQRQDDGMGAYGIPETELPIIENFAKQNGYKWTGKESFLNNSNLQDKYYDNIFSKRQNLIPLSLDDVTFQDGGFSNEEWDYIRTKKGMVAPFDAGASELGLQDYSYGITEAVDKFGTPAQKERIQGKRSDHMSNMMDYITNSLLRRPPIVVKLPYGVDEEAVNIYTTPKEADSLYRFNQPFYRVDPKTLRPKKPFGYKDGSLSDLEIYQNGGIGQKENPYEGEEEIDLEKTKRAEQLYKPIQDQWFKSYEDYNQKEFFESPTRARNYYAVHPYLDVFSFDVINDGNRNPFPVDNVIKEIQTKINNLNKDQLKTLLNTDFTSQNPLKYTKLMKELNIGFGEVLRYKNHIQSLLKQGYTFQDGGIKTDNRGYWNPENWGKPVKIESNEITMKGVKEPLFGISNTGDIQFMLPGQDYKFNGTEVTEYPLMQNGGRTMMTKKEYEASGGTDYQGYLKEMQQLQFQKNKQIEKRAKELSKSDPRSGKTIESKRCQVGAAGCQRDESGNPLQIKVKRKQNGGGIIDTYRQYKINPVLLSDIPNQDMRQMSPNPDLPPYDPSAKGQIKIPQEINHAMGFLYGAPAYTGEHGLTSHDFNRSWEWAELVNITHALKNPLVAGNITNYIGGSFGHHQDGGYQWSDNKSQPISITQGDLYNTSQTEMKSPIVENQPKLLLSTPLKNEKEDFIKIIDNRTTHPVTGEPINPNRDLKTSTYSKDIIIPTIIAAKKVGIDPYLALAVSLQETSLGRDNYENPYHLRFPPKKTWENYTNEVEVNSQKNPDLFITALDFASFLKEKMEEGKKKGYTDLAGQIQAYNGYGKVFSDTEKEYYGGKNKYFYGVDVTKEPLDMSKNPVYGKTVLSFIPFLKENKELKKLIDTINASVPKKHNEKLIMLEL